MKQIKKLAGVLWLVLAIIACNGTAVRTVEVTRVVPQTVVVTESVPQGGFTTGTPVDVSSLPALQGVGGDGGTAPCFAEGTQPVINFGSGMFPHAMLCLNNFPTAPDSPGFTVTLTDPTGRTFQESFTYSGEDILDSRGKKVGSVEDGQSVDGYPGTPGVSIWVYLPANFPCGDWSVSAQTQDGTINTGPTMLAMGCSHPLTSVVTTPDLDPFHYAAKVLFTRGETLHAVGSAYPPNTAITVALYQEDPSAGKPDIGYMIGTARYATSVMTDGAGNFQAPFLVGSETPAGLYYVVAAPVITPDIFLPYFGTRFSVK